MQKATKGQPFTLLDLGAGNGSPSRTTALFPNCIYHGLDLDQDYAYTEADIKALRKFYQVDLSKLEFDSIPNAEYDYINMAHIIEHLPNGDAVLEKMAPKLKKGGYLYIEYPGKKSTTLPSMKDTLNFYDDPTHVRVYNVKELREVLKASGFEIISSGTRRSWFHILVMPVRVVAC
ncbi:MAG TPA: class I SAM-dependent methyltransferase, partial [Ferruginibacter sp.]|nr:class I SAM-dependent methyltransferase [Ferruginibacter sp.]